MEKNMEPITCPMCANSLLKINCKGCLSKGYIIVLERHLGGLTFKRI